MRSVHWQSALAALVMGWSGVQGQAQTPAIVNADRVNLRSRPALNGEVITQLRQGQEVVILEEGLPSRDGAKDVTEWARVALPAGAPVWVSASFVDADTGAVKSRRLNARCGPSEDYGILGTVDRGAILKKVGETNGWWQIEVPPGLYAFVAAEFLAKPAQAAAPAETTAVVEAPPPATTNQVEAASPPPVEKTPPAPAIPVPAEPASSGAPTNTPPAAAAPTSQEPPAATNAPPALPTTPANPPVAEPAVTGQTAPAEEPLGPRVVRRQGRVRAALSIQAPTDYELRSTDDGKLINYLLPASTNINVRQFRGQIVIVSGPEHLDARWPNTAVMEVEDILLAP